MEKNLANATIHFSGIKWGPIGQIERHNDELSLCFLHTEDWSSAAALRKSSSVDSFCGFCHKEEDEPETDDDVSSKRITMVHE